MTTKSISRKKKFADYRNLEARRLLAGNVTVVENVHLYIRGDQHDNQFEIVADGDQLFVNGLDGTTINGQESFLVSGTRATESGVTFAGGVRAHLGPGHDDFAITDAQFEAMSLVYGGTGDDVVDVIDSTFLDRAIIQTYDGNDSVTTTGSHFEDAFFAITLDGRDSVTMIDSVLAGNSFVDTGKHSDTIHSERNQYTGETNLVLSFGGDDTVQLNNPVVGEHQLGVFLGNGDDTINADLTQATIESNIRIGGQGGVDQAPEMIMSDEAASAVVVTTIEHREVFDGGVGGAANVDYALTSALHESSNTGLRFATPVQLDSTEAITSIQWTGAYDAETIGQTRPEFTDEFIIEIFEGAEDGAPDSSSVTRFEVGEGNRVDSGETAGITFEYTIYDYSADVEFTFEAGKEYWVSIYTLIEENDTARGDAWAWGLKADSSIQETVQRTTWTPDAATSGDSDWRFGGEGERQPDFFYGVDMDIRLRS